MADAVATPAPTKSAEVLKAFDDRIKKLEADNTAKDTTIAELKTKAAAQPVYKIEGLVEKGGKLYAEPASNEESRFGFKSFQHFLHEVHQSGAKKQWTETITKAFTSEMVQKAAQGMGELIGSDGGFLVPPEFSSKIFERLYDEKNLLGKTDSYTVGGNSMVFPRNSESSRVDGARWGGALAYWIQEGGTFTATRPRFGRLTLNLHKLGCITPITQELIDDASPAVAQYATRIFANEINFKVGDSIINGTGAGEPIGILNSPCMVSVAKESGQAAATLLSANIVKMWARRFCMGPTGQYTWFINQDVGPQLHLLTLGIGTAGIATYMPPGGLSSAPYGTLMGAPIMELEWCSTIGTQGDIILADMSQMVSISKGGMKTDTSMHVYFTTDEQAFRTSLRLDIQPWQATALIPYKGSNTQSPFVCLDTRS